jgi:hypothetical protein
VDLNVGSVCPYCRAPLSMLDAHQVNTVVEQLKREQAHRDEVNRDPIDPSLYLRLAQDRMSIESRLGEIPFQSDFSLDGGLVEAGVAALVDLPKHAK